MDWDEARHKTTKGIIVGEDLKTLSVADLEERITALRNEIGRLEAEIAARRKHESAAAALFKR